MTGVERDRRKKLIALALPAAALTTVAVLYLLMANPEFRFMEGASAIKMLWARALLGGHGYREMWRIGRPLEIVRPPGFALFTAAVMGLFGQDMLALKIANNLFAVLGMAGFFVLARRRTGDAAAAAGAALAGFLFPHLFAQSAYFESEMMFCALLFPAMAFFERAWDRGLDDRRSLFLFNLTMVLSVMVRTVGFVLVPAALCALLFKKDAPGRKRLTWAVAAVCCWAVVGGGWMIRNQLAAPKGEQTYVDKLLAGEPIQSVWWLAEDHRVPLLPPPRRASPGALVARVWQNGGYFLRQGSENIWTGFEAHPGAALALFAAPAMVILIGLVNGLWRKRRLFDFFTLFYMVVILLWPYQDRRFIEPAWPLLVVFLLEGLQAVGGLIGWKPKHAVAALAFALAAVFLGQDIRLLVKDKQPRPTPSIRLGPRFIVTTPNMGAYHSAVMLEWIKDNTGPEEKVLFHSYSPCAVLSERQCSAIPMVGPDRLMRFIDESGISLVIVDDEARYGGSLMSSFTPTFLKPAMDAHPERFRPLYLLHGSDAGVYAVVGR